MHAGAGSPNQATYATLDALRGVAAAIVLLFHCRGLMGAWWPSGGWLAVDFFFCLSGFIVDRAYGARLASGLSFGGFMTIRFIRLWPMYLLGCAGGLALLCRTAWSHRTVSATDISAALPNLLFLPAARHVEIGYLVPLNPPGWSLVLEVAVNAAYALALPWLRTRVLLAAVAGAGLWLAFLAWSTGSIAGGPMLADWPVGLLRVTYSFGSGVVAARLTPRGARAASYWRPVLAAAALAAMLFAPGGAAIDSARMLVLLPALIVLGARVEPAGAGRRLAALAGRLSYPLYILQYPVAILILVLPRFVPVSLGAAASVAVLGAFVLLCLALERWFDRPVRARLTRWATARGMIPPGRRDPAGLTI